MANQRSGITCQLQVRSLTEELWGEISHGVSYSKKSPSTSCQDQLKACEDEVARPAARTASQGGRRAWRSSPKRIGRSPTRAGRRRAAPAVPFAPVPGTRELRRRPQGPALARRDQRRADEAAEVRRPTAPTACRAPLAVRLAGPEMSRTVQRHEYASVRTPHPRHRPGTPRVRNDHRKQAVRMLRRHAVRHSADAVAARDAPDAERRPRVRGAPTRRKGMPVRQKGRTPYGKHRNAARLIWRIAYRVLRPDRAHPAAGRTDHRQAPCRVRDIPCQSSNHTSPP